jgi:hypothetical protein
LIFYRVIGKRTSDHLEEIKSSDGSTIAIVVRKNFNKEGINFLSEGNFPLQLGINSYKKGYKIKGHFHQKREVVVNSIQEVIYFKSGRALVELYDLNKKLVTSISLSAGDLIFFVDGGHGFEMAEDTTFIEVKQGPYLGKDTDKELIE